MDRSAQSSLYKPTRTRITENSTKDGTTKVTSLLKEKSTVGTKLKYRFSDFSGTDTKPTYRDESTQTKQLSAHVRKANRTKREPPTITEEIVTSEDGDESEFLRNFSNSIEKVENINDERRNYKKSNDHVIEYLKDRLPLYGPLYVADLSAFFVYSKKKFMVLYENSSPFVVQLSDFKIQALIGEGAFGKVMLVQKKSDKSYFALKAIEKRNIVKRKQVEQALQEKRILQGIDFPFGVRLEYFAKDNTYIHLIMPFISGGELYLYLRKNKKFNETVSMFYAAQVAMGLEYLHNMSVVYRDVKPENLLLDHLGYVKITDFGFAKPILSRTYTFCGTPFYLAPEVITGHGYGYAVDWWSFGILLFELNAGYPPFEGHNQMTLYKHILACKIVFPPTFQESLKDLIRKLLSLDITHRYGNLRRGAEDIKDHAWFQSVDWMQMFNRRLDAPIIPHEVGTSHLKTIDPSEEESLLIISDTEVFTEHFKDF